jgi:ADP-ribose pyrophosphatase YjhB (NUDIX family)
MSEHQLTKIKSSGGNEALHVHEVFTFRFCPACGGSLQSRKIKENEPERLVCTQCRFVLYQDPKLVACSIVEMKDKIVLLRRAIEPKKGKWVVPGGYVDQGEEVESAALRETLEECGIKTRIRKLQGVYSYTGRVAVVVVYVAEYVSGDLIADDESQEVRLCTLADIPWEDLAFPSTVDALKDYYDIK